jgi:hypothetical protein
MVCQALHLFNEALRVLAFEHFHNAGMQHTPSLVEQTPIGDFVRESVLEGIDKLWKQSCLIEEVG